MQGDEDRPEPAGNGEALVRTGPRHAAPRKSLLTKWQMPASKAIALAAMPTAVFVGMGLTPKLAQADEVPGNPFAPGPCVTRSDGPDDKPSPSASPKDGKKATPSAKPSLVPHPSATGDDPSKEARKALPKPSESPSAGAGAQDGGKAPAPSPSPSEKERNPLDPLGLGDAVKGLLGGSGDGSADDASAGDAGTSAADGASTAAKTTQDTSAPDTSATAAGARQTAEATQQSTKEAIRKAADKAGATVEEVDRKAKNTVEDLTGGAKGAASAQGSGTVGKDGKQPFPCPTHDAKALAAADQEEGIPLLPDDPWRLESSKLTLRGLDYKGIVKVRTYSGKVKKVLKFTADQTDIKDLHQLVVGPQGTTSHVKAADGSTSTIRGDRVTMYTEKLQGNLFGLIPVTFSPDTPPPLNVPFAVFTDVKVVQAGQFGGTLTVPGMHLFNSR